MTAKKSYAYTPPTRPVPLPSEAPTLADRQIKVSIPRGLDMLRWQCTCRSCGYTTYYPAYAVRRGLTCPERACGGWGILSPTGWVSGDGRGKAYNSLVEKRPPVGVHYGAVRPQTPTPPTPPTPAPDAPGERVEGEANA